MKEEEKSFILRERGGSESLQSEMKRNMKAKFGNKLL
jgi:hypothetical protein